MRILYFIDSVSNYRSGVHASVIQTCTIMNINGNHVTLIGANENSTIPFFENINIVGFPTVGPKSLNVLWGLSKWLKLNLKNYDLVSIETIWSFSNYLIANACKRYNIPFIVTTHGMLHPKALKVSFFKKKIAKYTILKCLFENAKAFHALNLNEKLMIQEYGIEKKIFVVGNGINIPDIENTNSEIEQQLYSKFIDKKYCLYLGRLHPIKGVDRLIESWTKLHYNKDWHLVIAGDGESVYENYLKSLYNLSINDNISFVGFVSKKSKEFLYQKSQFCVLPSHSEAFPMALLESFSYAKPALITSSCVFDEAIECKAAIQVDSSNEGIFSGLNQYLSKTDLEISQMGYNGLQLIQAEFLWDAIYKKLIYEYELLTHSNNLKNK